MQFAYAMSIVMIEIGCGIWSNAYGICHMPHMINPYWIIYDWHTTTRTIKYVKIEAYVYKQLRTKLTKKETRKANTVL